MDEWQHWRDNLAGKITEFHPSEPHIGFYKKRKYRGGPWVTVALFKRDGAMMAEVDFKVADRSGRPYDPEEVWSHVCGNPISEDLYRTIERGGQWPDLDEAVAASLRSNRRPGSNEPENEIEILRDQIESAKQAVSEYATIKDDETCARAQSLRSRLLELGREADKKREAEKRPHLEAGKAIDAVWQPLVKDAKAGADAILAAEKAFQREKYQAEQRRRAEEQERQRRIAEEEAKRNPVAPVAPVTPSSPEPIKPAAIRGGYGRAATVREVKVAKVVDQDAAYGALREHPEMVKLIDALAKRAFKAGLTLPGVEIVDDVEVV